MNHRFHREAAELRKRQDKDKYLTSGHTCTSRNFITPLKGKHWSASTSGGLVLSLRLEDSLTGTTILTSDNSQQNMTSSWIDTKFPRRPRLSPGRQLRL